MDYNGMTLSQLRDMLRKAPDHADSEKIRMVCQKLREQEILAKLGHAQGFDQGSPSDETHHPPGDWPSSRVMPETEDRLRGAVGELFQIGRHCTVPNLGLKLLWVGPGTFIMGSPSAERRRYDDEGPYTQVTISRGFWLGQFEVKQSEWQAIMGGNPSGFRGDGRLPVEKVSWQDCQEFVGQVNRRKDCGSSSRFKYSLPTQAQWEYACRAGTVGPYAGGLDPMGWYKKNSGGQTHPVGQKNANPWGFHDMHGNVWEWCLDWYASQLPGGIISDYAGPASGSEHVARGGGWGNEDRVCRSATRIGYAPSVVFNSLGFRLALNAVQ